MDAVQEKVSFAFCGSELNSELAAASYEVSFNYAWLEASRMPKKAGVNFGVTRLSFLRGFADGMLKKSSADDLASKAERQRYRAQDAELKRRGLEEQMMAKLRGKST